ncbi:MAG TPA: S8 family serine peptidase [Cellulomonas sp.]
MSRRVVTGRRGVLATALALIAIVAVGANPAAAEATHWWWSLYHVDDAHAAGWTGAGVRIAVIGSQINPDLPDVDGTNLTVDPDPICAGETVITSDPTEDALHDSGVTALLIGNGTGAAGTRGIAPDADVTFIGYGGDTDDDGSCEQEGTGMFGAALRRAMDAGATIISTSTIVSLDSRDGTVLSEAIARGIVIVGGVSNSTVQGLMPAPFSYRGVVSVNAMDQSGALELDYASETPNIVDDTVVVAAGVDLPAAVGDWTTVGSTTGASNATPLVAGMLALTAQKYPAATGDQLIQSLIHNTGSTDHDLAYSSTDGFGYGLASLSHLLRVDPTQHPDENPLLTNQYAVAVPSDAELAAALPSASATATATAAPTATATASPADDPGTEGGTSGVVLLVAVVVVVVAGAAVAIALGARRARARSRSAPS